MNTELTSMQGDITRLNVDAVVNAANSALLGGGGVDGAIHRAAGPKLLAECRALNGCLPGEAKITAGYNLPARHAIHTVGPIWRGGVHNESAILESCYTAAISIARQYQFESIAFPCISTGAYGFPPHLAARIAIETVRREAIGSSLKVVVFCCFTVYDAGIYTALLSGTV